ncbi:uncharacterized protein LOC8036535 [Ixodes scapularis]|uniref:uncharacterized protein LOC8036535 n=1 Tax=Ixodes scapularis TaxID=6945 RepID=UPI001A9E6D7A|nr:uncharacterized protein LOC8036535 [Ixodes scapularis]
MASITRCLLLVTNIALWLMGACLLAAGVTAFVRPDLVQWLLNDDSGRSREEICAFYIGSGSCLLLTATVGLWGACRYLYGVLSLYLVLLCSCTAAHVVYLALQLNSCIRERVCTKGFDVESRRHWSILVQSLALFVLLVTLTLSILVCCKAKTRRGYLAVPL